MAPLAGTWIAVRREPILFALRSTFPKYDQALAGGFGDIAIFFTAIFVLGCGFTAHKAAEAAISRENQGKLSTTIGSLDRAILNVDTKLSQHTQDLQRNVNSLGDQLESIASLGLLLISAQFQTAIEEVYPVVVSVLTREDSVTDEELAQAIIIHTNQINGFVRALDGELSDVGYSCSIFIYRSFDELFAAEAHRSRHSARLLAKHGIFGTRLRIDDDSI